MKTLTAEQKERAVQLLDDIMRPGVELEDDRRMCAAMREAVILLGYEVEEPPKKKRARGKPAKIRRGWKCYPGVKPKFP
jgi:hypothetical protein